MTMTEGDLIVSVAETIHELTPLEWDALKHDDNPFIEHRFLAVLEDSGSIGSASGWLPRYLTVRNSDGVLRAAAPTYLRSNSYGEYIFDWAWARACQNAGIPYYPKVTAAVPFTPATGPRLLVHPQDDISAMRAVLGRAALTLAEATDCSSVHWLFCSEAEAGELREHGYLVRQTHQYHWHNRGWQDFDAFLADLKRKRRGEITRERRRLNDAGVDVVLLRGEELQLSHWQALHGFYRDTIARMGGIAYLTPSFFLAEAPALLAQRAVAVMARRNGEWIAGSLSFERGKHLYGRYWGRSVELPGLHFELCYHRLIEYAIEQGMTRFEAGAQGEHKISRGLIPSSTWSAHYLRHPGLREAVAEQLKQEGRAVRQQMDWLRQRGPYKDNGEVSG